MSNVDAAVLCLTEVKMSVMLTSGFDFIHKREIEYSKFLYGTLQEGSTQYQDERQQNSGFKTKLTN